MHIGAAARPSRVIAGMTGIHMVLDSPDLTLGLKTGGRVRLHRLKGRMTSLQPVRPTVS